MAAVIKSIAKSYVKKRTNPCSYFIFYFLTKPTKLANCHIDNYKELAVMINLKISNCEGIAVEVTSKDTEQEVDKLDGIKSYFHMSFNKKSNHYTVRTKECFCVNCMNIQFGKCDNKIEKPKSIQATVLGDLQAPGKESIRNEKEEADERDDFVVEKICGFRKYRGETQYLVKWEGYGEEHNSWLDLKNLNCPRLIAEFNKHSNLE
jgi:hypothetical protein